MLSAHRMRALLVKFRTMQVNQVRGLLYEFVATSVRAERLAWPSCGHAWSSLSTRYLAR